MWQEWAGILPAVICLTIGLLMFAVGSFLTTRQFRRIHEVQLRTEAQLSSINARAISHMMAAARAAQQSER